MKVNKGKMMKLAVHAASNSVTVGSPTREFQSIPGLKKHRSPPSVSCQYCFSSGQAGINQLIGRSSVGLQSKGPLHSRVWKRRKNKKEGQKVNFTLAIYGNSCNERDKNKIKRFELNSVKFDHGSSHQKIAHSK